MAEEQILKLSFKSLKIDFSTQTKRVFLCLESQSEGFYSIQSQKVHEGLAKFYGETIQIKWPSRGTLHVAVIDSSNRKQLTLIKRIPLNADQFSHRDAIFEKGPNQIRLNFTAKKVSEEKSCEDCQTLGTEDDLTQTESLLEEPLEGSRNKLRRDSFASTLSEAGGSRVFPIVRHRKASMKL